MTGVRVVCAISEEWGSPGVLCYRCCTSFRCTPTTTAYKRIWLNGIVVQKYTSFNVSWIIKFKTHRPYTSVLLTIRHRSSGFSSPPTSHKRSLFIGQNKSYDGNDSDLRCINLRARTRRKSRLVSPRRRCSLRLLLHTLTGKWNIISNRTGLQQLNSILYLPLDSYICIVVYLEQQAIVKELI